MVRQIFRVIGHATSYTVKPLTDRSGQVFTNKGAAAGITFTLPTPSRTLLGYHYAFLGVVDFSITVAGAANGAIVTKNDIAANSVAASTAGELIGAAIEATCVETAAGFQWVVVGTSVGHTFTVAT